MKKVDSYDIFCESLKALVDKKEETFEKIYWEESFSPEYFEELLSLFIACEYTETLEFEDLKTQYKKLKMKIDEKKGKYLFPILEEILKNQKKEEEEEQKEKEEKKKFFLEFPDMAGTLEIANLAFSQVSEKIKTKSLSEEEKEEFSDFLNVCLDENFKMDETKKLLSILRS